MINLDNINNNEWDEVFQMLSWWKKERVKEAKIMVVGAGALGNEVLKNLALLNVGHILIVDFDTIEFTNLSRSLLFREDDAKNERLKAEVAAEKVKELNPNVKVHWMHGDITSDIGLGVFRSMDAIVGCLDNRLARLGINRAAFKVGKAWVDGAIENLAGQGIVYKRGVACYESNLTEIERQMIRQRVGCPDVAARNIKSGRIPTTPITASIVGAIQAQEALKIVHGYDDRTIEGKMFRYEGMFMEMGVYEIEGPDEDVLSNFEYEDIISAPLSNTSTIQETLSWASENLNEENPEIALDHPLITKVTKEYSGDEIEVFVSEPKLADYLDNNDLRDDDNERIFMKDKINLIGKSFENQSLTLEEIGIPSFHIIRIETDEGPRFVELSQDKTVLKFK